MAGLRGQDRAPGAPVRERRNFDNLSAVLEFIGANEVIQVNGDGHFTLVLKSAGGLENDAGELAIKLAATPGLVLAAGGIAVLLDPTEPGLQLTTGLKVLLAATPGLEFSTGLRAKIKTDGGLVLDADGLSLAAATEAVIGGVLRQDFIDDAAELVDNSDGTSGGGTIGAVGVDVTDPGDAPVDVDALRDDLVANTIPSIETIVSDLRDAVATLAEYATSLEDKINQMLAAQITADQMSSS
jgi:hypothetical protein